MIAQSSNLDAQTRARAATRKYAVQKTSAQSLSLIIMLAFTVYFLLPLVFLLIASTKTNSDLSATNPLGLGATFNLGQNLHDVFTYQDSQYIRWIGNTLLYSVVISVGATFIASMAGYALAKYRFWGRELSFAIILGAIMVPSAALVLPQFLLLSNVHLINTYWSVILPSLVSPFGVYLMRVYCTQSIPDDLLDAARVDGASEFRTFWQVAIPVLGPGLVTVLLFAFVGAWNNYFLPLVTLSDPNLFPLTLGLSTWQSTQGGATHITFSLILTGSLVAILPLIVAFLFLQRYWRSGLTLGSLKG